MQMTNERLQEIKEGWWSLSQMVHPNEEIIRNADVYITQLIAAYENQGELLQLSLANVDRLNEGLAEAEAEIKRLEQQYEDSLVNWDGG